MPAAASTISAPSTPAARYSALEKPYGCCLSGGVAARRSIDSAITPAARLTNDSRASDSSPTEPVTHQARPLRTIVATAAAIESRAKRSSIGAVEPHFPAGFHGWERRVREFRQRDVGRRGGEFSHLQRASHGQDDGRRCDDAEQVLGRRVRIRGSGVGLLACPAANPYRPGEATLCPRRLVVEAPEVFRTLQNGWRVELVGREVFALAGRPIGDPAPRRAEAGNRPPP